MTHNFAQVAVINEAPMQLQKYHFPFLTGRYFQSYFISDWNLSDRNFHRVDALLIQLTPSENWVEMENKVKNSKPSEN